MSKRDDCKQGCCRVPFDGVCAKRWKCACHGWSVEGLQAELKAEHDRIRLGAYHDKLREDAVWTL